MKGKRCLLWVHCAGSNIYLVLERETLPSDDSKDKQFKYEYQTRCVL